jgi:hypothetical protein
MKENLNYPPPPPHVKKRFLTFLFAAVLCAALAGCGGEGGTVDNMLNDPGTKKPGVDNPGETGPEAPEGADLFVGWNDGMLTYPADYPYTEPKDPTLTKRWAFTKLDKITAYLNTATGDPVVIAVADGSDPSLTWQNLLLAIEAAGEKGKFVELDLSGSTLALFNEGGNMAFDYKDGGEAYNTGEQYIKKLILPRAATAIASIFKNGPFSRLEAASGLNVSAIPDMAFWCHPKLAAVAFPAAVTIGNNAFESWENCDYLASVSLPNAIYIGNKAFYACDKLTSVSLPKAETIGNNAFEYCSALTSVNLPKAETIGNNAFEYCSALTNVSLPEVTEIGSEAFRDCYDLTSVELPKANKIGGSAFWNCPLTTITIAKNCNIDSGGNRQNSFKAYYNDGTNGHDAQSAGVYTYSGGPLTHDPSLWSYEALN